MDWESTWWVRGRSTSRAITICCRSPGRATFGRWQGQEFSNRVDWFYELGFDGHSLVADPQFVQLAGADGILGYSGADYGQDDDFHLQPSSPGIDAGDPADDFVHELLPNGGRINAGHHGNTVQATASPLELVQVLSPNGLEKFEVGQQVLLSWCSAGLLAGGRVDVELSADGGAHWTTLAPGLTLDANGRGSYLWTIDTPTDGNTALIRVRAHDGSRPEDVSDEPFLIASAGADYYVNDTSTDSDVLTTASGDNALSGKSPDRPMASLFALLAAYDLDLGDVIHVDTGTYRLVRNIVIAAPDGGVRNRRASHRWRGVGPREPDEWGVRDRAARRRRRDAEPPGHHRRRVWDLCREWGGQRSVDAVRQRHLRQLFRWAVPRSHQ